jgi:hypothetical protein
MPENENIFNLKKFHESTTEELKSVENRVRNLIGYQHHPEDGRYKEAILRNMIKKFLPSKYTVGSGFIVEVNNGVVDPSTQIDILIFNSDYPTLFSEGDFYIVTPNSVKAVIEVKTDATDQLKETIEKLNKIGNMLYRRQPTMKPPFLGIFSYNDSYNRDQNEEYDLDRLKTRLENHIQISHRNEEWRINHLSLSEDLFVKYWEEQNRRYYSVYNLKGLSFSFFMSNVITMVTEQYIQNEFDTWFPSDKERNKLFDIEL